MRSEKSFLRRLQLALVELTNTPGFHQFILTLSNPSAIILEIQTSNLASMAPGKFGFHSRYLITIVTPSHTPCVCHMCTDFVGAEVFKQFHECFHETTVFHFHVMP